MMSTVRMLRFEVTSAMFHDGSTQGARLSERKKRENKSMRERERERERKESELKNFRAWTKWFRMNESRFLIL